jgi:hypothetical protein
MPQQELLKRLAVVLESADVAYMLTGSWASSIYGEPRSTHDVDIVIGCDAAAVAAIRNAFPAKSYAFDEIAAATAMRARSMFQILAI